MGGTTAAYYLSQAVEDVETNLYTVHDDDRVRSDQLGLLFPALGHVVQPLEEVFQLVEVTEDVLEMVHDGGDDLTIGDEQEVGESHLGEALAVPWKHFRPDNVL